MIVFILLHYDVNYFIYVIHLAHETEIHIIIQKILCFYHDILFTLMEFSILSLYSLIILVLFKYIKYIFKFITLLLPLLSE